MGYKQDFIRFMVKSGVLTFGDFITKSGRPTPYFVNTGNYRTASQISTLGTYYANCIEEHVDSFDLMYGPAYKGIPLVTTTAVSLWRDFEKDVPYCFNRKEAKDHGEGGSLVGAKPKDRDKVIIIEDVITAGSSIRESVPILKGAADVDITSLIISVDRMETGEGGISAIQEIQEKYGIRTYPIVNTLDIINTLYNQPVDGKIYIDEAIKEKMLDHLDAYGVK